MAAAKKRRAKGKSRAENVTGAKEGAVEVRTAAKIGDNSQLKLPKPDDYEHHLKSIRGCQDKSATAASLTRLACEAANKCSPGLAASVKNTLKIERENDPEKLKRHYEMMGMGLKVINSSIQITIFDTLAGDVESQAYKRGHDDGEAGRTANNAYPDGSELHTAYANGWRHGTAKNLGLTPDEADAAVAEPVAEAEAEEGFTADEPCEVANTDDIPAFLDKRPKTKAA